MSLECSECERDARSGHAKSCSRYRCPVCRFFADQHQDDCVFEKLEAQLSTTREMLNVSLEYIRQEKLYRAKVPSALGDLEYNEQIRERALMRRSLDAQAETLLNGGINGR